ncbi:hypothetical protein N9501_08265 [Amylibacter sp.]|nr:hypothetical protein [Amylibacter sp.]
MTRLINLVKRIMRKTYPNSLGVKINGHHDAEIYSLRMIQQIFQLQSETLGIELLKREKHSSDLDLIKHGYASFSQYDEDGIIEEIFKRIGFDTRQFCEIGVGGIENLENNTIQLLMKGWTGVWLEASNKNCNEITLYLEQNKGIREQLTLIEGFVTPKNINETVKKNNLDKVDLLSIDIDSFDYYVLESFQNLCARCVVLEYNAKFPPSVDWVVSLDDKSVSGKTSNFGASLAAYRRLMKEKNYELVGCGLTGANAYFVRSDLAQKNLFHLNKPTEFYYEPPRYHLAWGLRKGMLGVLSRGVIK